jgi:hypothetical protein
MLSLDLNSTCASASNTALVLLLLLLLSQHVYATVTVHPAQLLYNKYTVSNSITMYTLPALQLCSSHRQHPAQRL